MIDIGNMVFDTIFNAVTAVYTSADVTTGFDEINAILPCVVVKEVENVPLRRTATDDCSENHTRIVYDIRVYTGSKDRAKTEGRAILGIVDTALVALKFRRIRLNEPLNIARTLFCQYGRWEVIVGKPVESGEDLVYQMYRR